jgi:glycerol uptake facilitator-like aquaporin
MKNTILKWVFVKPDLLTKTSAEFLGCFLFHILGSLLPTPECNAVSLMILVFFTAKLSGGHLNPSITWIFNILGYTNPLEVFVYWSSQIGGCILGALFLSLIVPGLYINSYLNIKYDGCFIPNEELTLSQIMACEALGTFTFALSVFSVVWYTQNKKGYGTIGPIMVGLSLLAPAYAMGRLTGAAFNPARTLGSFIIYNCIDGYTVGSYIGGQMLGAFLASLVIIPWYGICNTAWYIDFLDEKLLNLLKLYQPSIILLSNN